MGKQGEGAQVSGGGRMSSPSRIRHNHCFPREWRGICERATQNPTQSEVRTEPQVVALG